MSDDKVKPITREELLETINTKERIKGRLDLSKNRTYEDAIDLSGQEFSSFRFSVP